MSGGRSTEGDPAGRPWPDGLVARACRWVTAPHAAGTGAALTAGLVLLRPWFGAGDLLVRDLVAVRDPAWSLALLDPTDALPRDVPGEVLAALAGQVVGGPAVVLVALLGSFALLGAGVSRLVDGRRAGMVVAGAAAVWNPWVWVRLQQGQWLVVVALAAVPWVVVAVADDDRVLVTRTMTAAALAGFVATVVVWPTLVVVAVVTRRWGVLVRGLVVGGLGALPWLVVSRGLVVDADGFRAFAANADVPFGTLVSLLSGGGYFNAAIASPWRAGWLVAAIATALAAAAAAALWVGTRPGRRAADTPAEPPVPDGATDGAPTGATVEPSGSAADGRRRAVAGLALAGLVAVAVVAVVATGPGVRALAALAQVVPPLAVIRDTSRLVAPWVVALPVGLGWVIARWQRGGDAGPVAIALALVVLALPDPVLGPFLPARSDLPAAWVQAGAVLDADPAPGDVLVVPPDGLQSFSFTSGRPVAVPLRRLTSRPVLTSSRLVVRDGGRDLVVDDLVEPDWSSLADLDAPAEDFAAAGIGWVAVIDPALLDRVPAAFDLVVDDSTLRLARTAPVAGVTTSRPRTVVLVLDAVLLALGLWAVSRRDARTRRTSSHALSGRAVG